MLRRSSSALLALVNDVLDFSKLEAGRMRVEHAPFDLHDAIHDAAEVFSAQAEAKGVDLLSHCTADLPQTTVGDAARLRQILHNLVGNAVKFTAAGEVRVFAAPERGDDGTRWVRVSVRDSGIGMTEAQVAGAVRGLLAGRPVDHAALRRQRPGPGDRPRTGRAARRPHRGAEPGRPGFDLHADAAACTTPPRRRRRRPLLTGIEVQVISASRSRSEDLAELVQRHGGRCECLRQHCQPAGPAVAGRRRAASCCATTVRWPRPACPRRPGPTAWPPAASAACCSSALATDARKLPRELVPLYRPAQPVRVIEALQRALGAGAAGQCAHGPRPDRSAIAGTRTLRVLLVEDNLVNQLVAQALLERLGAQVVLAGDGEQALQRLARTTASTSC